MNKRHAYICESKAGLRLPKTQKCNCTPEIPENESFCKNAISRIDVSKAAAGNRKRTGLQFQIAENPSRRKSLKSHRARSEQLDLKS